MRRRYRVVDGCTERWSSLDAAAVAVALIAVAVAVVSGCGTLPIVRSLARGTSCPGPDRKAAESANLALLRGITPFAGSGAPAIVSSGGESEGVEGVCPQFSTSASYPVAVRGDGYEVLLHYREVLGRQGWSVGCLQTPIDGAYGRSLSATAPTGRIDISVGGGAVIVRPDAGADPGQLAPPWGCEPGVPPPAPPSPPPGDPGPGNGLGPDGVCTGREKEPPCGPGVEVGRFYAYTWVRPCDERISFDGQRWLSGMPPPTPIRASHAWARFDGTEVRLQNQSGSIGFVPEGGDRPGGLVQC